MNNLFFVTFTRNNFRMAAHMLTWSLVIATLFTGLIAFPRYYFWEERNLNEDIGIVGSLIAALWVLYVPISAVQLDHAQKKRSNLDAAIRTNDHEMFLANFDKEVPFVTDFTILIISIVTLATEMLLSAHNLQTNLLMIFCPVFLMALLRVHVLAYDNPRDGIWKFTNSTAVKWFKETYGKESLTNDKPWPDHEQAVADCPKCRKSEVENRKNNQSTD